MEKSKVLSGEALVAKGITKIDASLPEVGLKDVTPNGSWLEQKQIQAALEARKYLIEVERIEKCGTLSHAEWRDDLMLAEVTQKAGGYWQYLGHNVGKTLFLRPEEALFLMEVNSLLLKHNEVTVSLQKAYSLLLNSSTSLIQYRVYSCLSRLGYKVFRHKGPVVNSDIKSCCQKINTVIESENVDLPNVNTANVTKNVDSPNNQNEYLDADSPIVKMVKESENFESTTEPQDNKGCENNGEANSVTNANIPKLSENQFNEEISDNINIRNDGLNESESPIVMELDEIVKSNNGELSQSDIMQEVSSTIEDTNASTDYNDVNSKDENIHNKSVKDNMEICIESHAALVSDIPNVENNVECQDLPNNNISKNLSTSTAINDLILKTCNIKSHYPEYSNLSKIYKLTNRQLKPTDSKSIHNYFENIPDLYKKQVVTVNVPKEEFIPKNIFVNNSNYLLDLQNIKKRSMRSASTESATYTSSDEVNGTNIRRIRSSSGTEFPNNQNYFLHARFPRHLYFRPEGFWRPQNNLNYYQFNMFIQRPNFSNLFFQSRVQYFPRPSSFLRSFPCPTNLNPNVGHNARKRMRNGRTAHLQSIKNLAVRLKQLVMSNNAEFQNLEPLQSLLHSYNLRYKSRLRLTENFDIVNEEKIIETIELDDDEESKSKKPRLEKEDSDKFDENLYRLRQLALRLRELEAKDKATASHRRAFSKAIKTFNKSYNADIYLNEDNYEVIDRRFITLESSSESDCVVDENPKIRKGKKLRNPFNILKRRSERLKSLNNPSTSKDDNVSHASRAEPAHAKPDDNKYNELIVKTFDKTWLPNENDFGRAEVVHKQFMNTRLVDSSKELYLYDFIKDQWQQYQNWLEAKISFLRHLEETNMVFQNEQAQFLADADLSNIGLRPLIDSEDCSDMPSVLEKLRIIKNNKEIDPLTSLCIDFDVYHRDVQNFRKKCPPKPHFRVICLEESSSFPSAADVMALHAKYEDNVAIVFAIVSIGSVSYLQINPTELPVYVPSNDIV